jgi:DNA replication and repair protein RecF
MLQRIWLKDYRNLKEIVLDLNQDRNCFIFGENNQGKTNFLEAIYFLANGQSLKSNSNADIVNYTKPEALLGLDFLREEKKYRLYIKVNNVGKKSGLLNNKQLTSFKGISKVLVVEYLSAEIIRIFTESPEYRRKEIDKFASSYFPDYSKVLRKYEKVIKQKNWLLKNKGKKENIALWNEVIVSHSFDIIKIRLKAVEILIEEIIARFNNIDIDMLEQLSYKYVFTNLDIDDICDYKEQIRKKLEESIEKEINIGHCIVGPHRDDYFLTLQDKSIQTYQSRGINRIFALLFKFAQLRLLGEKTNNKPILLIDDAFIELDKKYKERLVTLAEKELKFFYTTVTEEDKNIFDNCRIMNMSEGIITG